jgi:predicted nucleic acid-binding protein
MTVFADSSALVKRYSTEPGSAEVLAVEVLVASALARVEVPAALWRKVRMGELAAGEAQVLVEEFEADYYGTDSEPPRFMVVDVAKPVLDRAAGLTGRHGLRAYDAVQLASALAVREVDPACREFLAFDARLCDAAATEGFRLLVQ